MIGHVNVTINDLSHTFPEDVDLLLVGPTGQSVVLMADDGGLIRISGVNLTFDDAAAAQLPDDSQINSGTYKPSRRSDLFGEGCAVPSAVPAPAPAGPYGPTLAGFNGTNPNGTWSLYALDDSRADTGSIAGWSLSIDLAPTVAVAAGGSCGSNDRSGTINLTVADVDNAATDLTLSGASSNQALIPNATSAFAGSGASRAMTVTAVLGKTGTAVLTITASDGQGTGTVTVTVMVGGNGNDTLTGTAGADMLFGQNGDDTLIGLGATTCCAAAPAPTRASAATATTR